MSTITWTKLKSKSKTKPPKRSSANLFFHKNHLYMMNGWGLKRHNDLWQWNTTENQWVQIIADDKAPFPRVCKARTLKFGDKIRLFGGWTSAGKTNNQYELNLDNMSWKKIKQSGRIPSERSSQQMVMINSHSCILWGGIGKEGKHYDMYTINFKDNVWKSVSQGGITPEARSSCGGLFKKGNSLFFGCGLGCGQFNDVHEFDLKKKSWKTIKCDLKKRPSKRGRHESVLMDEGILVHGGYSGTKQVNDAWIFDLEKKEWTKLKQTGDIPSIREGHTMIREGNQFWLFGGWGRERGSFNDLYVGKIS